MRGLDGATPQPGGATIWDRQYVANVLIAAADANAGAAEFAAEVRLLRELYEVCARADRARRVPSLASCPADPTHLYFLVLVGRRRGGDRLGRVLHVALCARRRRRAARRAALARAARRMAQA